MTKVLFTFLALISSISAFSNDDALVSLILANEDTCVQAYEEDKIYLKPNQIFPTQNGLFLNINGATVPIDVLHSDAQGCYLKPNAKFEVLNRCPGCNRSYFITCKTLGCPYNPNTPK